MELGLYHEPELFESACIYSGGDYLGAVELNGTRSVEAFSAERFHSACLQTKMMPSTPFLTVGTQS